MDESLGRLIQGLTERKILSCVNIIVTSDHGTFIWAMSKNIFIYKCRNAECINKQNSFYRRCK